MLAKSIAIGVDGIKYVIHGCVGYSGNKTECEVYALAIWCHFIVLVLVIATQMENSGTFSVSGTLIFIVLLETLEHTHKVCYYVKNVHHGMQPCREVSVNK